LILNIARSTLPSKGIEIAGIASPPRHRRLSAGAGGFVRT